MSDNEDQPPHDDTRVDEARQTQSAAGPSDSESRVVPRPQQEHEPEGLASISSSRGGQPANTYSAARGSTRRQYAVNTRQTEEVKTAENSREAAAAADKDEARFTRLRNARETFFHKLNTRDASNVDEDFLDDLYVLAMSWRTQEDLVWPARLRSRQ